MPFLTSRRRPSSLRTGARFPAIRGAVVAVVLTAAVLAGAPTAGASTNSNTTTTATAAAPNATSANATFAVQPAAATGAVDTRADFSYSATPGATIQDHASIRNYSDHALTLAVAAGDAFNTADGGFDVVDAHHASTGVGAWVVLGERSVTIPAHASTVVAFRIAVPVGATPGDHAGGILASLLTQGLDAHGDHITVENRVGAQVHLRVTGPLVPRLVVQDVHAVYHGALMPAGVGRITVSYTVRNTGNVELAASPSLRASNALGRFVPVSTPKDLPVLLPGSSLTLVGTIAGVEPGILTHVTVSLTPRATGRQLDLAPVSSQSAAVWTVPWSVVIGLAVLGPAAAWFITRRARRGRAKPPGLLH